MIGRASANTGSLAGFEYTEQENKKAWHIEQKNLFGETPKEKYQEMKLLWKGQAKNHVIDAVISPPRERGEKLSKEDWQKIANQYINGIGAEQNQWYAVVHRDTDEPHMHLKINRHDFTGKLTVNDFEIGIRTGRIMDKIAKGRGWPTSKDIGKGKRKDIEKALRESQKGVQSWQQLQNRMKSKGYHLKLSQSDKKGIYGMRVIPNDQLKPKEQMSDRELKNPKGYKLSEITRQLKMKDIQKEIDNNKSRSYER